MQKKKLEEKKVF
jgi:hypothetical protein